MSPSVSQCLCMTIFYICFSCFSLQSVNYRKEIEKLLRSSFEAVPNTRSTCFNKSKNSRALGSFLLNDIIRSSSPSKS